MKRYPAQDLEPAVRDPKKLRRTALILIGIMLVGAVFILIAYNRDAARRAEDTRPAITGRLNKNFKVWRQDETEAGLLDLRGDVFVIVPVVFSQPDSWDTTREVLLELEKRYESRDDLHIVCVTQDPENEPPELLAEEAKKLGAELPKWWLAGSREESVHKFFKNVLKANIMAHRKDGEIVYDASLVVIDRDRHIRQPTVRARKASGKELNYRNRVTFDFEGAAEWDEKGRSEGLEKSNVETMKDLLFVTIDELLAQPVTPD
ncbi:hypothetical protein [Haloferula rosea]|uniref:Thioredoxin domain-containing protein n=1 Tax=Haloferula rosea TaxID=490093 RepID=A0A934RBX9_9BACT|nr:hypothetical protein [Haloferula rosea]MBK1826933.1 hypothetical protein [Haloferula rosea]